MNRNALNVTNISTVFLLLFRKNKCVQMFPAFCVYSLSGIKIQKHDTREIQRKCPHAMQTDLRSNMSLVESELPGWKLTEVNDKYSKQHNRWGRELIRCE